MFFSPLPESGDDRKEVAPLIGQHIVPLRPSIRSGDSLQNAERNQAAQPGSENILGRPPWFCEIH